MYDAASTTQANSHMEEVHHISKGGPMQLQRKQQRTLLDMVNLHSHRPKDQALMNAFISSFEPLRFQHLLIRWVACDNIPFHKLESPYFGDLMAYANSAIADAGSIPIAHRSRAWGRKGMRRSRIDDYIHSHAVQVLSTYTQEGVELAPVYPGSTNTEVFEDFIRQLLEDGQSRSLPSSWTMPHSTALMERTRCVRT